MEVKEQWQKIKENLYEGFKLDPEYVREFYTNNILQRTLSILLGQATTGIKPVQVSEDGRLLVAIEGGAKTSYDVFEGDALDTDTTLTFSDITSTIDIIIEDYDAIVSLSVDGVVFGQEFTVKAGEMRSFDFTAKALTIRNAVAGSVAKYRIMGWR